MPRLLILEDEPVVRKLCARFLTQEGYEFDAASNIAGAKALLKESRATYDLLVTDLRLPDGNGADFVPFFRTRFPRGQVLVITGSPHLLDDMSEEERSRLNCLLKPFDVDAFVEQVRRLTGPAGKG